MKKVPPKVPTSMSVDRAKKKSSHRHVTGFLEVFWSGRSDSNTLPLAPHASFPKTATTPNYLILNDLPIRPIEFD